MGEDMGLSQVSIEEIESQLVSWSARESAVKAELLGVLAEWMARRGWERWGCTSPQQWLSWKCGLGRVAASVHIRVAMALTGLPAIAAALADGRITWSKVRAITRVATPASEQEWLTFALAGTAEHVDRLVRSFRRITPADAEHQHTDRRFWTTQDDDGSTVLHAKLPTEIGAAIATGLRASVKPERGVPLAARMADRFVEAVTGGATIEPDLTIHVDAAVLDGEPGVCATASGYAVAPEVALQAVCGGSVRWAIHDGHEVVAVSRERRFGTAMQRRAAQARSRTCELDGCDDDGEDFDLHHVVPDAHGGRATHRNMRRLCKPHHRLVHLRGWRVQVLANGRVGFVDRDGRPVDHRIPTFAVRERPPAGTPVPAWCGEPLDVNLALDALFSNVAALARARIAA